MIDRVISCLRTKGVERLVNTSAQINAMAYTPYNIDYYIEDVRSAVFNAYGMSKISHAPVAIIVEEAYLPNTYTALTEAWFQRVPVVVLAVNSINLESSSYLNRCVDVSILINTADDIESAVCDALQHHGPTLLKIKEKECEEEKIDYTNIYSIVDIFANDAKVLCYNPQVSKNDYEYIMPEYKYGVISKYVGQLVGGRRVVLCIPEYLLALDTNIFNFRDFPDGFKLIVKYIDGSYWNKLEKWLNINGIQTIVADSVEKCDYLQSNRNFAVLVK